ncbi:MAG: ferredoxin [Thermoplasmata archaeon HGW-Thermoplasmata-1]|nr:MAG: ferredoxin [Thermoplasmata archaeon HGW-Thermoplasmata-1]
MTEETRKCSVGTAVSYPVIGAMGKTGTWRTYRPVIDNSQCIKCLRCWIFCPEGVIVRGEDDSVSVDYVYCKGCGVCANECPKKCISMIREGEE